jgi:hypothetical protein
VANYLAFSSFQWPTLRHLNINGCIRITGTYPASGTRPRLNLHSLVLHDVPQLTDSVFQLVVANVVVPLLQQLEVSNCNQLTTVGLQVLADHRLPELRRLTLDRCYGLTGGVLQLLAGVFLPALNHLSLRRVDGVTDDGLVAFASRDWLELKSINLGRGNPVTDHGLTAFAQRRWPCLEAIVLGGHRCRPSRKRGGPNLVGARHDAGPFPALRCLCLWGWANITNRSLQPFATDALPNLLDLHLLAPRTVALANTTPLPRLRRLQMWSDCTDECWQALLGPATPELRVVDINANFAAPADAIKHLAQRVRPQLDELSLTNCTAVADDGVSQLTPTNLPVLRKLVLSGPRPVGRIDGRHEVFTSAGLVSLASPCWSLLERCELAFDMTNINSGLQALRADRLPSLEFLSLGDCHITDAGFLPFITQNWCKMQRLELDGCSGLTDKAIDGLVAPSWDSLAIIRLGDCWQITTQGWQRFASRHWHALQSLSNGPPGSCYWNINDWNTWVGRLWPILSDYHLRRCIHVRGQYRPLLLTMFRNLP